MIFLSYEGRLDLLQTLQTLKLLSVPIMPRAIIEV